MHKRYLYALAAMIAPVGLWPFHAAAQETVVIERPAGSVGVPGAYDPELVQQSTTVFPNRGMEYLEGIDRPGGLFVRGEYLYLKPRRRSQDFAIIDPINQGAEVPEGSVESLEWDRRSAYRVGAGYATPSGWDLGVNYTYFHTNDSRSLVAPEGGTLLATMTRPGIVDEVNAATASSSLDYDVVDIELGATVLRTSNATFRMFGGSRLAWIDQKLTANYDGNTAVQSNVDMPLLFDGYGPRLGGQSNLHLGGGLALFARASGSLLVGDFRTRITETNSAGATLIADIGEKYEKVVPVTELGLGISWQFRSLRLSLGYEVVNWFGLVESRDFVDDWHEARMSTRTSNLSLDGFFFNVAFTR